MWAVADLKLSAFLYALVRNQSIKHMKYTISKFLPALAIGALLGSCNPQGAEYADELDLVITLENDTVDYASYQSYTLADTIVFLSNVEDATMDEDDAAFILDELNSQMKEQGWVEAKLPQDTGDVVLLVSVLENVNVSIYTGWWDYWGPWYGWDYYYPGGGWYYPGYPGGYCCYTSVYSYRKGTILIEMLDPNKPVDIDGQVPKQLPIIWGAGINGLLEGSKSNIRSRIEASITQVFNDSPYLNKR